MTSSVSIPDSLRKTIKKLAALYDTTQSEIIKQAIKEFETRHPNLSDIQDPKLLEYLTNVSKKVLEKRPQRKRRMEKLSHPLVPMERVSPSLWAREVESGD